MVLVALFAGFMFAYFFVLFIPGNMIEHSISPHYSLNLEVLFKYVFINFFNLCGIYYTRGKSNFIIILFLSKIFKNVYTIIIIILKHIL